jgi:3-hydroxyacyl-[acyl-carrier-protein] dehydratase
MDEVRRAIPHRPPFLFVDQVVEITDRKIKAIRKMDPEEAFFAGHYPGYPIMPGVLVCEAIFQTGAILLSRTMTDIGEGVPVLGRINNAKFKQMVRPGDTLELEAELVERIGTAYYMKGRASVGGKTAVTVEYAVALAREQG